MRSHIICLLLCLALPMPLSAQELPVDPPTIKEGSGPGSWMGLQAHDKYFGLSIGYPLVQRGGRSLGLHLGYGGYSADNNVYPYPGGIKEKTGMNLGLYAGGHLFCGAGVERLSRTDSHQVVGAYYQYSSYDTTEVHTDGYVLLGYRSWPGFGIYVQAGRALGIGVGISIQM